MEIKIKDKIRSFKIVNARLPGYEDLQEILIQNNRIALISDYLPQSSLKKEEDDLVILDVHGDLISLGGVDLQINGALGLAFPDLTTNDFHKLREICQFLWFQGLDAFCPTIVTTSLDNFRRSLSSFGEFIESQKSEELTAKILGVHLEGPFLNVEKRGAHPAHYLLPLTIENVNKVLGDHAEIVKIITLAPELDVTGTVIPYLKSLGITVSLGHSQATEFEAKKAFDLGASMVTHAFNAMPSLHHRQPGLLGAAIINPEVMCGFIADGQHVCNTMLKLLLKASDYQGLFLVSDALSPLGLPEGIYPWDDRYIEVKDGTAKLPCGTLSGTTLGLFVGVQNLVQWDICNAEIAIALATSAPRKAININEMFNNSAFNLLRWHFDKTTKKLVWKSLTAKDDRGSNSRLTAIVTALAVTPC